MKSGSACSLNTTGHTLRCLSLPSNHPMILGAFPTFLASHAKVVVHSLIVILEDSTTLNIITEILQQFFTRSGRTNKMDIGRLLVQITSTALLRATPAHHSEFLKTVSTHWLYRLKNGQLELKFLILTRIKVTGPPISPVQA